jgi:hypothetical protein
MPSKRAGERAKRSPKKPAALNKSLKFMRDRTAGMRKEALTVRFKYRPHCPDTFNPRPTARRIKRAIEAQDTPHRQWLEIHDRVHIMVLCAGNMLSCDAPLESQYLAAFQRIADRHADQTLHTPEEADRSSALICASLLVIEALDELDAAMKGGAS